jgi:hypothetical protein
MQLSLMRMSLLSYFWAVPVFKAQLASMERTFTVSTVGSDGGHEAVDGMKWSWKGRPQSRCRCHSFERPSLSCNSASRSSEISAPTRHFRAGTVVRTRTVLTVQIDRSSSVPSPRVEKAWKVLQSQQPGSWTDLHRCAANLTRRPHVRLLIGCVLSGTPRS